MDAEGDDPLLELLARWSGVTCAVRQNVQPVATVLAHERIRSPVALKALCSAMGEQNHQYPRAVKIVFASHLRP
jgi:hypothetical protein